MPKQKITCNPENTIFKWHLEGHLGYVLMVLSCLL